MIAGEMRAATRFTWGRRAITVTELGPKGPGLSRWAKLKL